MLRTEEELIDAENPGTLNTLVDVRAVTRSFSCLVYASIVLMRHVAPHFEDVVLLPELRGPVQSIFTAFFI